MISRLIVIVALSALAAVPREPGGAVRRQTDEEREEAERREEAEERVRRGDARVGWASALAIAAAASLALSWFSGGTLGLLIDGVHYVSCVGGLIGYWMQWRRGGGGLPWVIVLGGWLAIVAILIAVATAPSL